MSETELLAEQMKAIASDIRELKVAFEQSRRDVATGFVSRDILDLHLRNFDLKSSALEKEIADLREQMKEERKEKLGTIERTWLRVGSLIGSFVGLAGLGLALLQYLRK